LGCVVRSAILDGWVRSFMTRHPAGTVVELGTGLNTRFDRLDNGTVRWFAVAAAPGPYLFLWEAVFVYLAGEQVGAVLSQLAQRFEASAIAFDTTGTVILRNQHRNGSMHAVSARMRWVCEDPHQVEQWGMPLLARLLPAIVNSYKLNLFRLGTQS
jgi:O-methyltransferase involved in polyketide biosynthesis